MTCSVTALPFVLTNPSPSPVRSTESPVLVASHYHRRSVEDLIKLCKNVFCCALSSWSCPLCRQFIFLSIDSVAIVWPMHSSDALFPSCIQSSHSVKGLTGKSFLGGVGRSGLAVAQPTLSTGRAIVRQGAVLEWPSLAVGVVSVAT